MARNDLEDVAEMLPADWHADKPLAERVRLLVASWRHNTQEAKRYRAAFEENHVNDKYWIIGWAKRFGIKFTVDAE